MQRESYRLDNNVRWSITNASDPTDLKLQARWEKLYGRGGFLGFSHEKKKVFYPDTPVWLIDRIDTCHIERLKRYNIKSRQFETREDIADIINDENRDGGDEVCFASFPEIHESMATMQKKKREELQALMLNMRALIKKSA